MNWVVFCLALITRLLGWVLAGTRADEDGAYLIMAQNFLSGRGFSIVQYEDIVAYSWLPPGMPMLRAFFLSVFQNNDVLALRLFFILLNACAVLAFYHLAKRLFRPSVALLSTAIWLFYPPQWFWGSRINPHPFAMDGLVLCLYALILAWERRSFFIPFCIGLFWAFISLVRAEFSLGLAVLCLTSIWGYASKKDGLKGAFFLVLGCALGLAPWVVRNYRLHNAFVLVSTNYGDSVWKAYNPAYNFKGEDIPFPPELKQRVLAEPNEVKRARILTKDAVLFMKENPLRVLRNVAGNFLTFWKPWVSPTVASKMEITVYLLTYVPIFFLFVWGLFLVPWKSPHWQLIGGFLLYKCVMALPFYVIVAQREAVMPLIILISTVPLMKTRV